MFHRHNYELDGFNVVINGLIAPKGHCFNMYKCTKCGKVKVGEIREMTLQECTDIANSYKERIEDKGE